MQNAKNSKLLSMLAVCLVAVFFVACIPSIGARAASYSGSGTKADPYLVQTAEQLQGMRENLSAHYKLANTIDLSGVDFKPIGRLDAPFTGSFSCELNSDNTPKYIIKNLNINVKGTYDHTKYVDKKGKMEAGMFGATNGASISGIYVLDAYVRNEFFGDDDGVWINGVKTFYPGMDDMTSAILIGQAQSTTVSNCATTGTIDTRSNNCGGLIGLGLEITVKNCYSTANVKTEGKWNVGGLIGNLKNGTVSSCYATGTVEGSLSCIGSFVGAAQQSTIMDSYATGDAKGGRQYKNSFAVPQDNGVNFKNCFALGACDATTGTSFSFTTNNCWALSGKVHNTKFAEGSLSQISAAFKGQTNWNADGSSQPKHTGIGVVTDASKYVPETVSQSGNSTSGTTAGATTSAVAGGTTGTSVVTVTPEQVAALIEALPNPEDGTITLEHKEAIKEASEAYDSLSVGDKEEFDAALGAKLEAVRYKISILLASELVDKIIELPEVDELTPEYVDEILEMWSDYEFIDESVLAELDKGIIDKLKAAHEYAANIKENGAVYVNITDVFTGWQKVVLLISVALFVAAIILNVVMVIIFLKRTQSPEQKAAKAAGKVAKKIANSEKKKGV